jgi:hypothetical protein
MGPNFSLKIEIKATMEGTYEMGEATVLAVLADPHCKEFAGNGEGASSGLAHVRRQRTAVVLVLMVVVSALVMVLVVMLMVVGGGGQHNMLVLQLVLAHLTLVGRILLMVSLHDSI